jgi:predicted Zn-dependent peptidase
MKAALRSRPSVDATPAWGFPSFRRGRLANGMHAVLCHLPGRALVHLRLVLPRGIAVEDPAIAGVAATSAAALYEGTGARSADDLAIALEQRGASSSAGAHWRGLQVATSVPAVDLAPVLELLTELVREPAFRQDELEALQRRRLEQLAIQRFQPKYRSVTAFVAAAFPSGSRLAIPGEGTAATVAATTPDDIRRHWMGAARPGAGTVIVVGDLSSVASGANVETMLDNTLGTWLDNAAGDADEESEAVQPSPPSGRSVKVVNFPGAVQTNLHLGAVTGGPALEDRVALSVAAHYLGGFIGSRLSTRIREQLAASYGASASVEYRLDNTVLRLQSSVETGATALAAAVMAEEAAALAAGDVRGDTMREAIDNLVRAAAMRFSEPGAVAAELEGMVLEGLPDDFHQRRAQELLEISPAAVTAAFGRHTSPAGLCGAAAGSAAAIAGPLEALGYDVLVEPGV